jgi:hypothetical protein
LLSVTHVSPGKIHVAVDPLEMQVAIHRRANKVIGLDELKELLVVRRLLQ